MKHEVTTLNTKKTLADTLKNIMRTKPFSKITVSEIINECGVNRKTFYYHFEDKYALLKWILEEEAIEIVKNFDLLVDYEEAINFVMDYVEKNDYLISCAYDSIGRDEMKRFFYSDFISVTSSVIEGAVKQTECKLSDDFKLFLAEFYTEAIAGMLIDWVKDRTARNREQTITYLTTIIKTAIYNFSKMQPNE